jgi:hypothetical protein
MFEEALDYETLVSEAADGERAAQIILEIADYDPDNTDALIGMFQDLSRTVWNMGDLTPNHFRWELARTMCLTLPSTGPLACHQPAARAFLAWLDEVLDEPRL